VIIDFSKRTRYYNTAKPHRLIMAAEQLGLQRQMYFALLQAYHVAGENISDMGVLLKIAGRVGVTVDWVLQAMTSETVSRQMRVCQRVSANMMCVPCPLLFLMKTGLSAVQIPPSFLNNGFELNFWLKNG